MITQEMKDDFLKQVSLTKDDENERIVVSQVAGQLGIDMATANEIAQALNVWGSILIRGTSPVAGDPYISIQRSGIYELNGAPWQEESFVPTRTPDVPRKDAAVTQETENSPEKIEPPSVQSTLDAENANPKQNPGSSR